MQATKNPITLDDLRSAWTDLNEQNPGLRIREAAARLDVSEADLLATRLGDGVTVLRHDPRQLVPRLAALGSLMALTRNEFAVHERHGVYEDPKISGNIGLINTADIDLRLDFSPWAYSFAETKRHAGKTLSSFQFFDQAGTALHKVYVDDPAKLAEYNALVDEFRHEAQQHALIGSRSAATPTKWQPAGKIEKANLQELFAAWEKLVDTHRFDQMHSRLGLERLEAIRMAEGVYTRRVLLESTQIMLQQVAKAQIPIMVFIGNAGCLQIHTGTVQNVRLLQAWVNVLDPQFNLHLDTSGVVESWIVTKPTKDGPVHSLELYAADDSVIVQFFGKRKPGLPELPEWRAVTEAL